jgi:hypothetical protein
MDIALMSMVLSRGQFQQQASMSIMKMAMGDAEQQGEALQKLMGTADGNPIRCPASFGW